MSDDIKVSLIGVDGKVRWIDQRLAPDFIEKGWRSIVNPKENYYPQYDQAVSSPQHDEVGNNMKVVDGKFGNVLGIIVI